MRDPIDVHDLRPEVLKFAMLMERNLRRKSFRDGTHTNGWKGMRWIDMVNRIRGELTELRKALKKMSRDAHSIEVDMRPHAERIVSEAADVANFAMMIADVYGGLLVRDFGMDVRIVRPSQRDSMVGQIVNGIECSHGHTVGNCHVCDSPD